MNKFFKNSNIRFFKLFTILGSIVLLIFILNFYIDSTYSVIRNNFYNYFNQCDFENAESELSSNNFILKLKKNTLREDLKSYFTNVVAILCKDLQSHDSNSNNVIPVLKEIKSYNVVNDSIDKLLIALDKNFIPESSSDYEAILAIGIDNYNAKNYSKSIEFLSKIDTSFPTYYTEATEYINKCREDYTEKILMEATSLAKDDYYTKAIDLLYNIDTTIIDNNDAAIVSAISTLEFDREEYLESVEQEDYSETSSTTILENLNFNTINSLDLNSSTPNLIYVSIADQNTYVFTGSMNEWLLTKSFPCSTGIDTQPTPIGIYNVTGRGEWFFSDEFAQGGKYWVQFLGDYLFHSVPYDETQTEILDTTLGEPASHGCIRLDTEDAKWLYENISDTTKVIIN